MLRTQTAFMSAKAAEYPSGNSMYLISMLVYEGCIPHITIVLKENSDLNQIREKLPFMANVAVLRESTQYPLVNNKTTFYVCNNHNCLPAVNEIDAELLQN